MADVTLMTVHGFWSSTATWDRLNQAWSADPQMAGLQISDFGYPSPKKPRLPFSPSRIPDYDDIAQTLATYYAVALAGRPAIAIVTHSQGGLILQRFLAWMLQQGRGQELARIVSIVTLACPNNGSDYVRSLRHALGYGRHPQAGNLETLNRQVADTQRAILARIVNATGTGEHYCHVPVHVYAGDRDRIVPAASAQAAFPGASTLAGDHSTILDPAIAGSLTAQTVRHHILEDLAARTNVKPEHPDQHAKPGPDEISAQRSSNSRNDVRTSGGHGRQDFSRHEYPSLSWPIRVGLPPLQADSFQERPELIENVMAAFTTGDTAVVTQTHVVTGDGGVGKSQLAIQIWHGITAPGLGTDRQSAGLAPDLGMWLTASSRSSIVAGYAGGAQALGLAAGQDEEAAARAFLSWLTTTERSWLIILDDLADPADLAGLWPPTSASSRTAGVPGRVLITTRRRDPTLFGYLRTRIDVGLFTSGEAVAFVKERLRLSSMPGILSDEAAIAGLAEDLAFLPVALAQASAYILKESISPAAYRVLFQDRQERLDELMPAGHDDEHDADRSVAATWSLAIEHVNKMPPVGAAAKLAELIAVLDPNGVPEAVLTSRAAIAYTGIPGLTARRARHALLNLHWLSIITHDPATSTRTIRMHALAQRATRENLITAAIVTSNRPLDHDARRKLVGSCARAAGDALLQIWPNIERDTDLAQTLRANTDSLWRTAGDDLWLAGLHPVLRRAGNSLGEAGLVDAAVQHWSSMLATSERFLGPDHPDSLTTRGYLADWRGAAGDLGGALTAFQDLLKDCERVLGKDHRETLNTRSNLASWRGHAGDPSGAFAAFNDLYLDCMRVLRWEDPLGLEVRDSQAYWRGEAGDPIAAAADFEILLADRLRLLGHDDVSILKARHDLAYWRGQAGQPLRAAEAFEDLLVDRLRVLGPDHPDTLSTRSNVASWRGRAGDPARAAADFEGLLVDRLRVLGPDHPDTLSTRSNLASWRGHAGDPAGAAADFEGLLVDRLRVLGPDHPDILTTRRNVATWRVRASEAEPTLE